MSALTTQPQNKTNTGNKEPVSPAEGGELKGANVTMPATEVLIAALFPLSTHGLLFKLATYISGLFDRVFGTIVYDLDPVDGADSGYPICGPCCT